MPFVVMFVDGLDPGVRRDDGVEVVGAELLVPANPATSALHSLFLLVGEAAAEQEERELFLRADVAVLLDSAGDHADQVLAAFRRQLMLLQQHEHLRPVAQVGAVVAPPVVVEVRLLGRRRWRPCCALRHPSA